ncbi:protein red1 [Colletotrichum spaethianum]|uniref:Protein red1 n=1 Tax=Colletotrichum spaethianum TaxID=700344 RepID=A0AA37L9B8_9PEZI|nr:protein red1 [Colletotrichum spaethianum]GKT42435.1 protein red1 [Colletotrichum spaethianum]
MNNYYPYGYSPYPGQAPAQQQPYFPTMPPFPPPAAAYAPHTNTFDTRPQAPESYDQSQIMIPGLGYSHSQGFGWPQPQPPQQQQQQQAAPQVPYQQSWQPPREGPNLIPAAQYYQSGDTPKSQAPMASGALPPTAPKALAKSTSDDAEEGELSDGELDDVYEPQENSPDTSARRPGGSFRAAANVTSQNGNNSAGYTTADWHGGVKSGGMRTHAAVNIDGMYLMGRIPLQIDADPKAERERSGSYSPHLSPHEVHPHIDANNQHSNSPPAHAFSGQAPQSSTAIAGQQLGKKAMEDARQRAQSAILNLWPLGVRHQDYIDEGIDKDIVKDLLTELKLDPGTSGQSTIPGLPATTHSPGLSQSYGQSSSQPVSAPTSAAISKPTDQAPSTAARSAGEERKDRIARLLAAKSAKSASSTTNSGAQAVGASDKTAVQQQKQDALQKSRDARAQKAAERKGSFQASQSKEASPASPTRRPSSATAATPIGPSATQQARNGFSQQSAPQAAPASTIPGLFMSTPQSAAINNQRKRPVAADFVSNLQANKRPFGLTQQDKPFVIDVSDASDDEDVEMEIGSPTDEPANIHRTDTPSRKTASFRDFPPLTEGLPQRQLSSPAPSHVATPQSGVMGTQPKQAHIDVMDKQIEAMKRKIALAEARARLKAAMNSQSGGLKSNGQTPDTALDSETGKPGMRRVQSMGASSASDQPNGQTSPVVAEASSSMRLPKPSDKRIEGDSSRAQKLRAVSTNLPLVENRLQAKKSKLRLLQSQMSRLEKEIEEEMAEKQKLTEEMEQLDQDSDESGGPQNQLKSNSVDPVVTQTSTGSHSKVQSPLPAAAIALADQSAGMPTSAFNTPVVRPAHSPSTEHDKTASILHEKSRPLIPANHEVLGDDEESRPATSDNASDVVMGESDDSSSEQDREQSPDVYEPPENTTATMATKSPSISPVAGDSTVSLVNSETDLQQTSSRASPIPEQISLGVNESTPERGGGAVPPVAQSTVESSTGDRFTPYESPLQYFRAYRFHPKFAETVPGGLRSLTYSNRIDPNLPICPDQLARRDCPRGADCIYQHFESMKLPDDQILLQLGGTTLEGPEKAKFNEGLRKLLQEMRSQNIKDFPSIAQGIVDYRNRFTGDPSKILPLGNVSI